MPAVVRMPEWSSVRGSTVRIFQQQPSAAEAPLPVGVSDEKSSADRWAVISAMAVVAVAAVVATLFIKDSGFSVRGEPRPVDGLTIFAVFFVAAQAIERLLEPFASWIDPRMNDEVEKTKAEAENSFADYLARSKDIGAVTSKMNEAAQKKVCALKSRANRKIIFWAVATAIAILAAAGLKLYFLQTVGIGRTPRALDIIATGLIIGAGTKPLHDLVTMISAKSEQAKLANTS
jgi:hypothetical protein